MRDEKEGRKKQARSNKQTRQSNTAHPCTCTGVYKGVQFLPCYLQKYIADLGLIFTYTNLHNNYDIYVYMYESLSAYFWYNINLYG